MASPARAIQRKRIHNLSTGRRLGLTCAAALAVAGCGSTPTGPSGPVALTADLTMPECDPVHLTCSVNPNALETLTFVLETAGRSLTLHARLVWLEVSDESAAGRRLELIVDTVDQPGWWEVHAAVAGA